MSPSDPHDIPVVGAPALRGFALYVGLSEELARSSGLELSDVAGALRERVTAIVPSAESRAHLVVGPRNSSSRDLEVVMRASGKTAPPAVAEATQEVEAVVIDLDRYRVLVDERDANLSFKEFALLQELVRNEGTVLGRQQLRRAIATSADDEVNDRTIDVHIRRVRQKLGAYPDLIRTVHRRGYRFDSRKDVTVVWSAEPPT